MRTSEYIAMLFLDKVLDEKMEEGKAYLSSDIYNMIGMTKGSGLALSYLLNSVNCIRNKEHKPPIHQSKIDKKGTSLNGRIYYYMGNEKPTKLEISL